MCWMPAENASLWHVAVSAANRVLPDVCLQPEDKGLPHVITVAGVSAALLAGISTSVGVCGAKRVNRGSGT